MYKNLLVIIAMAALFAPNPVLAKVQVSHGSIGLIQSSESRHAKVSVFIFVKAFQIQQFLQNEFCLNFPRLKRKSILFVLKIIREHGIIGLVKFCDRIIHPKNILSHSQPFHLFIRKLGKKQTNIVLRAPKSLVECNFLAFQSFFCFFYTSCIALLSLYSFPSNPYQHLFESGCR